jgi:peptidyl-prolyl cis-trans isomerase C
MRRDVRHSLLLFLLVAPGCQDDPPLAPASDDLPAGIAARVGSSQIRLETVARIAAAQAVSPGEARERAVFDALVALEAERRLAPSLLHAGERSAHARALLESLAREAEAKGPPLDTELDELLRERWVELDRPESVRVVHAVVLLPKDGSKDAARQLATALQRELSGIADSSEFLKRAEAFPKGELGVRAERLPAITPDGRGWQFGERGPEPFGNFDLAFTRAAHGLREPGAQSELVETRFGFHLILLEERLPEQRASRDDARRSLMPDVIARRADRDRRALVERLESEHRIEVSRNFEALTGGLESRR